MEKELQSAVSVNSQQTTERRPASLIWTRNSLLKRLKRGRDAREKFVASQISNGIAFQIRALRKREELSQPELAEKVGTTQNQIYRLEKPNLAKPTITTLKKIAAAFDVALVVRFVPFSQLVDWVSGTPFVDMGLSREAVAVPSFSNEMNLIAQDSGEVLRGKKQIVNRVTHRNVIFLQVTDTPLPEKRPVMKPPTKARTRIHYDLITPVRTGGVQ